MPGENTGAVYLSNAFSISMIPTFPAVLRVSELSIEEAKRLLGNGFISAIGHAGTAQILSQLLQMNVTTNRASITLRPGDRLIVFQLMVRLNEGQVLSAEEVQRLYAEGKAKFYLVELL